MVVNDLYGYVIIGLGIFVGCANLYIVFKYGKCVVVFLKILYSLLGFYFGVVFFNIELNNVITADFGTIYIRPAIALTLGALTASTILTLRTGRKLWMNC